MYDYWTSSLRCSSDQLILLGKYLWVIICFQTASKKSGSVLKKYTNATSFQLLLMRWGRIWLLLKGKFQHKGLYCVVGKRRIKCPPKFRHHFAKWIGNGCLTCTHNSLRTCRNTVRMPAEIPLMFKNSIHLIPDFIGSTESTGLLMHWF